MRLQIIACIVLASLVVGCSGQSTPEAQKSADSPAQPFSHVIATEVEYYKIGPQQGRPPDGKFPAGTKVNIIRQAGSYTQVRSEGGIEATVASDAIKELGTDGAATSKAPYQSQ
jgi:PBP1b-binding outer membrane lipoprotein LpoB